MIQKLKHTNLRQKRRLSQWAVQTKEQVQLMFSKKESGTKSGGTSQLLPKSTEKRYLMSRKPQPQ